MLNTRLKVIPQNSIVHPYCARFLVIKRPGPLERDKSTFFPRKRLPGCNNFFYLVWMQRSISFYTVNMDQFLLGSKNIITENKRIASTRKRYVAPERTSCLEHIETLSTKYKCLYHETYIKSLLNIDAINPLLCFSLNFNPIGSLLFLPSNLQLPLNCDMHLARATTYACASIQFNVWRQFQLSGITVFWTLKKGYTPKTSVSSKTVMPLFYNLL